MTNRQQIIGFLLALYVVTIGGLTIYHAFNFSDYAHSKGDETINYTIFLLLTSVLFQGLIWIIVKVFDWKAAILATIVNFILSCVLGFGILMVSGLSGIPRHLIFLYGGCYVTFFSIVTVLQSNRLKTKT
jgi:uncharacterized Tic20 family protein